MEILPSLDPPLFGAKAESLSMCFPKYGLQIDL